MPMQGDGHSTWQRVNVQVTPAFIMEGTWWQNKRPGGLPEITGSSVECTWSSYPAAIWDEL